MDDLATSYLSLMEDPRPFPFFDVERALREVPWPLEVSLERVPSGFRPSDYLSRDGLVYLALLGCPPFHNLPDNEIRDVRQPAASGIYRHTCPHREHLLMELAGSLLSYEQGCNSQQDWTALQESMQMGLLQIRPFVIILQNLKQRKQKPEDRKLRGKANRYQQHYNELVDAIPRLTSQDYYHGREPLPGTSLANVRKYKEVLLTVMYEDFTDYGPDTYSQQAIFESITSILNTLAITNDRKDAYTVGSIKRFILREQKQIRDAVRKG